MSPPRLLAIGLDAADAPLALAWAREGRLPVLGRLLREGASVRLRTYGDLFPESLWPTIATGRSLASHGIYNWRVVPHGRYALDWVRAIDGEPIWQLLSRQGLASLLVDIPYASPLEDDRVTELIGWGQRGSAIVASWPPDLMERVRERYGRYPTWLHQHFHRRAAGQRRMLRNLVQGAGGRTRMVAELLRERPWSFAMVCYSEPHNAGHEFHRYLDPGAWGHKRRRARGMEDGLLRVYQAVDDGVGELIEAAGEPLDLLVFSGMGFRACTSGERLLQRVMVGLGYQVRAAEQPARMRPLAALRSALPWSVRHRLHLRLSQSARESLMDRLWVGATDWTRSRAYAEAEPGVGFIHLNVRGRDPEGLVAPGSEYDALCDEIEDELRSLREAESGEPAVVEVIRPGLDVLPDLVVRFSQERLLEGVRHPRLGVVHEKVADTPYSEHTGEGFLVASGRGIRPGATLDADLESLAPTMLSLMGAPLPDEMDGEPLSDLLQPRRAAGAARPPSGPS
jgi:predicted AlkP superfamily phosphohydrolase/phosphomutase